MQALSHLEFASWADNPRPTGQFGLVLPLRGVIWCIISLMVGRESHPKPATVTPDVAVICEMGG